MKHLKTYENNKDKIYLVIETELSGIPYYIFTVNKEDDITYSDDKETTYVTYTNYAYYASGTINTSPANGIARIGKEHDSLKKILYKTNDYQDAIEKINMIITTTKFKI